MLLQNAADDRREESALVREVVVDGRLRDSGFARDVIQRRATNALLPPQAIRCLKDTLSRGPCRTALLWHFAILPTGR